MKHERTLQDLDQADKVVLASGIIINLMLLALLTFYGPHRQPQHIKNNAVKTEMFRGNGR